MKLFGKLSLWCAIALFPLGQALGVGANGYLISAPASANETWVREVLPALPQPERPGSTNPPAPVSATPTTNFDPALMGLQPAADPNRGQPFGAPARPQKPSNSLRFLGQDELPYQPFESIAPPADTDDDKPND